MIHICEAGLGPAVPMGLTGYTEPNRGSLMYIRNDIYRRCLRVYEPKEEDTGAEIIQIKIDTVSRSYFGLSALSRLSVSDWTSATSWAISDLSYQ